MFIKSWLLAGLAAAVAAQSSSITYKRCPDSLQPDAQQAEEARVMSVKEDRDYYGGYPPYQDTITVPLYMHIVSVNSTPAGGNAPESMVQAQYAVLSQYYAQAGVKFDLKGVTRTVNREWSTSDAIDSPENREMRSSLRRGGYDTLNIYFQTRLDANGFLLGYCPFPKADSATNPNRIINDGCRVRVDTMPGGTLAPYDEGKTAVHEAGHWNNLFHTFQGQSCSGPGDYVRDTPQESSANTGGCRRRDSCPSQPGYDPIQNFMDYSYDKCLNDFTDGQTRRIHSAWQKYRKGR